LIYTSAASSSDRGEQRFLNTAALHRADTLLHATILFIVIRVALDTVLTSARVLQDLRPPEEQAALNEIERLHEQGLIMRVTTEISRIEERRISTMERREKVQAGSSEVSVVQPSPVLLGFSNLDYGHRGFISSPIMSDIDENVVRELEKIGLGTNDARAIAYAAGENAKCDYFASHDLRDLNPHKVAIETLVPQLRIVKPTEFIAEWNAQRLHPGGLKGI
jgi:hypothetical protein